ncbi:MAG: DUF2971 domain-containing protein [candidate division Zixibacteria bacterium]|nr:DUF2971 domain-containing protein [candidate division Zixibacteria bacterium]
MKLHEDADWMEGRRRAMVEKKVPQYLYKFRSWSDNNINDRKIITNQMVWFASPASLNDPFDCKIPFRYDLMPRDGLFKRISNLGRERHPDWDEQRLRAECERIMACHPSLSADSNVREKGYSDFSRLIEESHGILSFAGVYKNILLWSHYADSHHGFCVEVDAKLLAEELFDLLRTDRHLIDFAKVKYEKELPVVIPLNDTDQDHERYMKVFCCKSPAWQYEKEYRFIYVGKTSLARYISKSAIRRVILGCQMNSKVEREIISIITHRLPDCKIWKAKKSNDNFKLEFAPI